MLKICTQCNKRFSTDKKNKKCDRCRKYNRDATNKYQERIIAICDNRQCAECKELYAQNWICIHKNKKYRTLKELGIKPITNGENQHTRRRKAICDKPIPSEKFKIIVI